MEFEVNGQRYASWHDVPAELRALVAGALPDRDGDGVPDVVADAAAGRLPTDAAPVTAVQITAGGKTYDSVEALPPELRESLRRAHLLPGPTPPAVPQPAARPILPPGTVMLNGEPVDVASATGQRPERRRWWQRRR